MWPRFGEEPVGDSPRQNYFESIYHSAAVFGISTSAQIEAAIVGRPVHTLITDEFRGTQVGTAHFKHLEDEQSSMLVIARSFEEHAELLERSLRGELPDHNDDFVRDVRTATRPRRAGDAALRRGNRGARRRAGA